MKSNMLMASVSGIIILMNFLFGCGFIGSDKVTKANYDAIHEGTSYAQVVKIIGSEGEELASSKMNGVPGMMSSISTKAYSWQNSNGSNMNAMFQNDRLINKAQFGLK